MPTVLYLQYSLRFEDNILAYYIFCLYIRKINWEISSVVERFAYTEDATGSNPVSPTIFTGV